MKLKNPMLVVSDMEQSVAFYRQVLGLRVVMDFGANKTLTGGLSLQTRETYRDFIGTDAISFGGNDFEVYFEEDDEVEKFKLTTTVRGNSLEGRISIESPIGKAILGHKVGDRVFVKVNDDYGYYVQIRSIENTEDDGTDKLRSF